MTVVHETSRHCKCRASGLPLSYVGFEMSVKPAASVLPALPFQLFYIFNYQESVVGHTFENSILKQYTAGYWDKMTV